jgi:hypothetical protein
MQILQGGKSHNPDRLHIVVDHIIHSNMKQGNEMQHNMIYNFWGIIKDAFLILFNNIKYSL